MKDNDFIIGEEDTVSNVYYSDNFKKKVHNNWRDCKNIPQRYNSSGELAYVWVLVCLYNLKKKTKRAVVAKYEPNIGWLNYSNNNIENEEWKVTHWTTLPISPQFDEKCEPWSID